MGESRKKAVLLLIVAMILMSFAGCGRKKQEDLPDGSGSAQMSAENQQNEVKDLTADIASKEREADKETAGEYSDAQIFSKNLFLEILEEKNPVLSPVSAYLALALAGEGAENETAEEFETVMGKNRGTISGALMKNLSADGENITLRLANSAWVDEDLSVEEKWLEAAKNIYVSQVFQTELATEKTKRSINWWVEENTGGLIRNFLSEPLKKDCKLALFNTVYFKGKWRIPFEAVDTYERPFTLADGKVVNVETMNLYRKYLDYFKTDLCEGIVLSYRDSDLVFAAVKPTGEYERNSGENKTEASSRIRQLLKQLELGEIAAFADQAESTKVNLHLPKFEVSFDKTLNEDLINMGLVKAFDAKQASFAGLGRTADGSGLYIDTVRQKAVFILDEEGTEAAAVTEIQMFGTTAMQQETIPVEVDFNEPFLYLVLDLKSGMPLFAGIMDDPSQAQKSP